MGVIQGWKKCEEGKKKKRERKKKPIQLNAGVRHAFYPNVPNETKKE